MLVLYNIHILISKMRIPARGINDTIKKVCYVWSVEPTFERV